MLRTSRRPVKVTRRSWPAAAGRLALCAALVALSGCYWRQYPRLMETHLSLLLEYGEKLDALAEDHQTVAPERWGEFTYPLDRARDFSRIARKRFADRASLRAFDVAVARYADLVADPKILESSDAAKATTEGLAALRRAVDEARRALDREQGGAEPPGGAGRVSAAASG